MAKLLKYVSLYLTLFIHLCRQNFHPCIEIKFQHNIAQIFDEKMAQNFDQCSRQKKFCSMLSPKKKFSIHVIVKNSIHDLYCHKPELPFLFSWQSFCTWLSLIVSIIPREKCRKQVETLFAVWIPSAFLPLPLSCCFTRSHVNP